MATCTIDTDPATGTWFCWPSGCTFMLVNKQQNAILSWVNDDNALLDDDLEGALHDAIAPMVEHAPSEKVLGWDVYRVPDHLAARLHSLPLQPYTPFEWSFAASGGLVASGGL